MRSGGTQVPRRFVRAQEGRRGFLGHTFLLPRQKKGVKGSDGEIFENKAHLPGQAAGRCLRLGEEECGRNAHVDRRGIECLLWLIGQVV